jgi:hypothetical protein
MLAVKAVGALWPGWTELSVAGETAMSRIVIGLALVLAMYATARAQTPSSGIGTAGWWVHPCELFQEQVASTRTLSADDLRLAALCQGLFTGIQSVNFIEPPYLPFCVRDNDNTFEYAAFFVAFMREHPNFADKNIGVVVLLALGRARPKAECNRGAK